MTFKATALAEAKQTLVEKIFIERHEKIKGQIIINLPSISNANKTIL